VNCSTYIIVGAGLAAVSAAEAIRSQGFDGRILILGNEPEPPYERPPLSKELLRGEFTKERVMLRSAEFYSSHQIELATNLNVTRVDPHSHQVTCESGAQYRYDKLLIATGAAPRRLPVTGSDLSGVYYLRTLDDALRLRSALEQHPRVLTVGAGFIGCEVAASARSIGCEVVLLDPDLPIAHALGPEVGSLYAGYHRQHGVAVKTGVVVEQFRGKDRLEDAVLSDGTTVPCDVAVIGVGVAPSMQALPAELQTRNGVEADEFCRTKADDVFAAGDVAFSWRPRFGRRARMEHYDNAEFQGAAAGRTMCEKLEPYDPIPFFWSYQYDLDLQYYGLGADWEQVVLRGKPDEGSFIAFYLRSQKLQAACAVNRSRDTSMLKRLIGRDGLPTNLLADDHVPLRDLAAVHAAEHR
jgi:3-phenylpropionate/trans-cinnamate dioxygenase ferredoxin reductase subunit